MKRKGVLFVFFFLVGCLQNVARMRLTQALTVPCSGAHAPGTPQVATRMYSTPLPRNVETRSHNISGPGCRCQGLMWK